jgi:hypothetical protein
MAKNRVQFQKGLSLPDFFAAYGSEAQCAETLFRWRWPLGFVCPECGRGEGYTTIQTRGLLPCKHCCHQTSLTAGTIFAASKLPLTTRFLALYLLTQQKTAISAMERRCCINNGACSDLPEPSGKRPKYWTLFTRITGYGRATFPIKQSLIDCRSA